jgi:hypothetical protein
MSDRANDPAYIAAKLRKHRVCDHGPGITNFGTVHPLWLDDIADFIESQAAEIERLTLCAKLEREEHDNTIGAYDKENERLRAERNHAITQGMTETERLRAEIATLRECWNCHKVQEGDEGLVHGDPDDCGLMVCNDCFVTQYENSADLARYRAAVEAVRGLPRYGVSDDDQEAYAYNAALDEADFAVASALGEQK